MTKDSKVLVYPHGSPDQSAIGKVDFLSEKENCIAVVFECPPPFFRSSKAVQEGVFLLAKRMDLNGAPWGPWVELSGGGHYEIEEAS